MDASWYQWVSIIKIPGFFLIYTSKVWVSWRCVFFGCFGCCVLLLDTSLYLFSTVFHCYQLLRSHELRLRPKVSKFNLHESNGKKRMPNGKVWPRCGSLLPCNYTVWSLHANHAHQVQVLWCGPRECGTTLIWTLHTICEHTKPTFRKEGSTLYIASRLAMINVMRTCSYSCWYHYIC